MEKGAIPMQQSYDVVIIGGGVVGSAIARELSRYKLRIAVLEGERRLHPDQQAQHRYAPRRVPL